MQVARFIETTRIEDCSSSGVLYKLHTQLDPHSASVGTQKSYCGGAGYLPTGCLFLLTRLCHATEPRHILASSLEVAGGGMKCFFLVENTEKAKSFQLHGKDGGGLSGPSLCHASPTPLPST